MRKLWLQLIFFTVSVFFFSGCKKNMVEEIYTPIINPVIPDFTTKINASVNGFITNESNEAVEGAVITAGAITTTTDEYGYFNISNADFAKSAGFIQVSKPGYFTSYRTFVPVQNKETFVRLKLIPKTNNGTVDSRAGGTVTISNGATVTLPADAVVIAGTNTAYTGNITVAAHWFNPSEMQETTLTMPGDLTGVDSAGHLNVLQTFGMLAVELTGSSGEVLQVAPGKKAALHFPLPASVQSTAPAYIPLWYFDETKAVWKQEGHAIKNGNSYDGEVSHFSFWNCDVGLPLITFTAQFVDTALNPLVNTPVTISTPDILNMARTAYTDTDGVVTGLVPANSILKIDLIAPCNQNINANTITTTTEPVDLGTLTVNANQYAATLEGTVTKCNGSPVTNGYVIVTGFGNNAIININNGVFSRSGIICPSTTAGIIAFDRETSQQSDIQTIVINTGSNTTGNLQACTANTTEMIAIDIEGLSSIVYTLPQHLFGGNFYFINDSTTVNAIDLLNSNQQVFLMSFTGGATTGSHLLGNRGVVYINNSTWVFDAGTTVNITAYGLIGQFITGTISGNATGSPPLNDSRPVTIEFNIQRDQ